PLWASRYPKRAALMAAAGPAGNLAIALAAFVGIKIGLATGWFHAPESANFEHLVGTATEGAMWTGRVLSIFLVLNVLLFVFNQIPVPPLDGAGALGLVLPAGAVAGLRQLVQSTGLSFALMLFAWIVFPYIVGPLFSLVLLVLYPGSVYRSP